MDELTEEEMTNPEPAPWETRLTAQDVIHNLLIEKNLLGDEVSEAFLKGLRDRLLEIEEALSK
jgi:hypothetical protein